MAIANLAQLKVKRAIFHDVPSHSKLTPDAHPILCDIETELTAQHQQHLKLRLSRVLNSAKAYPIVFVPVTDSPVPTEVRAFTSKPEAAAFVVMSQLIATFLFTKQHGAISGGLLCVLDVEILGKHAVVLMKLEREQGAQLKLKGATGKKTFDMSVLDNLVLTDGTRLFKTAMFLRTGTDEDDFESVVCDDQGKPGASADMAQFWMRFIGGQVVVEPRIATQRFYDATLEFINDVISDPVTKNDMYEHLHSQLKAASPQFSPKSFIESFLPDGFHKSFRDHLKQRDIPLATFKKDLGDIEGRLKRAQYRTTLGAVISVPIENSEIVKVTPNQIVVTDSLKSVDHK